MKALPSFCALVLINQFEMSAAWYFIVFILWFADVFLQVALDIHTYKTADKEIQDSVPGIRGSVDGDKT